MGYSFVSAFAVVGLDDDLLALLRVGDDVHNAGDLGQRGLALRLARLEQLLDAGKTLRDVLAGGNAAGMEGTHGQLGAGLADGLGRDDADGLAHVHELAVGHVRAVALGADADAGLAGQHASDRDFGDARVDDLLGQIVGNQLVGLDEHLASVVGSTTSSAATRPRDAILAGPR